MWGFLKKFQWGSKVGIFGDGVGIFTQKHLAALFSEEKKVKTPEKNSRRWFDKNSK